MGEKTNNVRRLVLLALVLMLTGCSVARRARIAWESIKMPTWVEVKDEEICFREYVSVITIPDDGRFFLGHDQVNSLEELRMLSKQRLSQAPAEQKAVYIKAANTTKFEDVVKVADMIESLGIHPNFVTTKLQQ